MHGSRNIMDFNNHNQAGFTLIEVMVATLIIGITLSGLLVTQQLIMNRVAQQHQRLERIPVVKDLFANPLNAEAILNHERIDRTIADPETQLSLEMVPAKDREILKDFEGLYVLPATAQWDAPGGQERKLVIGTLLTYVEPEDEKKKK